MVTPRHVPIQEPNMVRKIVFSTAAVMIACCAGAASAADKKVVVKAAPAAAPAVTVTRIEDCSAFYDDYHVRGFGWGVGPGSALGFGTFEGALPRYPYNEFPNWYGECLTWGHYSASGTAISSPGMSPGVP
jgi:hypothetical protein